MKKLILLSFILLLFAGCGSDDVGTVMEQKDPFGLSCDFIDYSYSNGYKAPLTPMSNEYLLVGFYNPANYSLMRNLAKESGHFDTDYPVKIFEDEDPEFTNAIFKFDTPKTCDEIANIIYEVGKSHLVAYANYTMESEFCTRPYYDKCVYYYGSNFMVAVQDEENFADLERMMEMTKTELVGKMFEDQDFPNLFILRATKNSNGHAIKIANLFFETGNFKNVWNNIDRQMVE